MYGDEHTLKRLEVAVPLTQGVYERIDSLLFMIFHELLLYYS